MRNRSARLAGALLVAAATLTGVQALAEDDLRHCANELQIHCAAATPGEGRLLVCLYADGDKLSSRCELALYDTAVRLDRAISTLTYVASQCRAEIGSLCTGLQAGGGRIGQCLLRSRRRTQRTVQRRAWPRSVARLTRAASSAAYPIHAGLGFGSETTFLLRKVIEEMAMKKEAMVVGLSLLMALPVFAQEMFFYPSQGQTPEQQSQDRAECQVWAQQQSGVDPTQPAPQVAAAPVQQGQVVRGAARGGLLGVVGGAIGGDVGKGAAIGAGVGATKGLLDRRRDRVGAEQAQQQALSTQQAGLAEFNNALRACMQGRGYSVS